MDEKLARKALEDARHILRNINTTRFRHTAFGLLERIDQLLASKSKPIDFAAIIERGSCSALVEGTDSGVKVVGDCRPEGRKMKPIPRRKGQRRKQMNVVQPYAKLIDIATPEDGIRPAQENRMVRADIAPFGRSAGR